MSYIDLKSSIIPFIQHCTITEMINTLRLSDNQLVDIIEYRKSNNISII